MNAGNLSVITQYLKHLDEEIANVIRRLLLTRKIAPHKEDFAYWELNDYEYNQKGNQSTGGTLIRLQRSNWLWAIQRVCEIIFKCEQFTAVQAAIEIDYPGFDVKDLESYSRYIIGAHLENSPSPDPSLLNDIQNRFCRDIMSMPFSAEVVVELNGVILESKEITIDDNTVIRQTTKEDLETPKAQDMMVGGLSPNHTAVMKIHFRMANPDGGVLLQNEFRKRLMLMRLFCVGSIEASTYAFSSDRIVKANIGGKVTSGQVTTWKQYYLKADFEPALINFFKNFKLPDYLYLTNGKQDYLTVAFDRYKESLLEIVKLERRVANAVMGIEALLSTDKTELSFRMKTRIAKILSTLCFEPLIVRERMGKAYEIRSKFAHGGFLSAGEIGKLDEIYGDSDNFSLMIINYLRVLLIVFIGSGISKTQIIILVDDALIDDTKNEQLKSLTTDLIPFINGYYNNQY